MIIIFQIHLHLFGRKRFCINCRKEHIYILPDPLLRTVPDILDKLRIAPQNLSVGIQQCIWDIKLLQQLLLNLSLFQRKPENHRHDCRLHHDIKYNLTDHEQKYCYPCQDSALPVMAVENYHHAHKKQCQKQRHKQIPLDFLF